MSTPSSGRFLFPLDSAFPLCCNGKEFFFSLLMNIESFPQQLKPSISFPLSIENKTARLQQLFLKLRGCYEG